MNKLKYIIIFVIFFSTANSALALDINYGSILSRKNNDFLIQYYGIGKKNNYICNVVTLKCSNTKKTALITSSSNNTSPLKTEVRKELQEKGATHITISNDKKWLAYYIPASGDENTRTYVIKNLKTNTDSILSEKISYWDIVNEQRKVFEFSPDSKSLVYLDDKDDTLAIYKVVLKDLNDTELKNTKINTTAFNISYFIFSDSLNIYYVGNNKTNPYNWALYQLNFKTGKEKIIETNVSYVDGIIKVNNSLVFIRLQNKGYGPEIYNTKTGKLSFFKVPNIITKRNIVNENYVKIGEREAVIMMPPNYNPTKSYPVMIWLHGGPLRQTSLAYHPYRSYGIYDATLKLLQKNNVIVVKLDYRGSYGYGRKYAEGIALNVGKGDIEDVMNAVDYMKSKYNTGKFYLSGNSYGGYMALRALVEHKDSFAGIMSINGVTDWESLLVKMKTSIFNTDFNGLPNDDNRNLYDQASIIDKIKKLGNQKIEIIQGASDNTIPSWQATMLTEELEKKDKNVNLTMYEGEDHVFKEKKNIGDICVKMFNLIGIPVDKECTK